MYFEVTGKIARDALSVELKAGVDPIGTDSPNIALTDCSVFFPIRIDSIEPVGRKSNTNPRSPDNTEGLREKLWCY